MANGNGYREKVRRTIAVDISVVDGMARVRAKMVRRKEWLSKAITWNDVIHELLVKYGADE